MLKTKRKKIAWITKTRIKARKRKPKYCCDMMKYAMGEAKVIQYSVLPAIGHIEIDYCPWCRKKLKTIFEVKNERK